MALLNHNTAEHPPTEGAVALPSDDYLAQIVASEVKSTKKGNGSYLELKYEVISGPHAGSNFFSRHNIDNPNQTAQAIGRGEITKICNAQGKPHVMDSIELHGIPMLVEVACVPRDDKPDQMTNEVKAWKPRPTAGVQQQQQQQAQPPWVGQQGQQGQPPASMGQPPAAGGGTG